jgi:hypothetical protein
VAGVVRDVKYRGMREIAPPTFFTAFRGDAEFVTLYVRTHISEAEMMGQVRAMLATAGPGLAPVSMASMEQEIETSLWQERMLSFLSGVFGVFALLIAGLGLFGLITFTLARGCARWAFGSRSEPRQATSRIYSLPMRRLPWDRVFCSGWQPLPSRGGVSIRWFMAPERVSTFRYL